MHNTSITQSELKDVLHYAPDTGIFTWIARLSNRVKIGDVANSKHNEGYTATRIRGKAYLLHQLAWLYIHGEIPSEIDHINGIRDDNRIDNLRAVNRQTNMRNAKKPSHNTSGIVGVSWCKELGKWRAQIKSHYKSIHLGYFDCKYRAASTYELAKQLDGGYTDRHGT